MADTGQRVRFEVSVSEPEDGGPPKLFVWVRRFEGDEEMTGRYEVFGDLQSFDDFISRNERAGEDTASLRAAREGFAATLGPSSRSGKA